MQLLRRALSLDDQEDRAHERRPRFEAHAGEAEVRNMRKNCCLQVSFTDDLFLPTFGHKFIHNFGHYVYSRATCGPPSTLMCPDKHF